MGACCFKSLTKSMKVDDFDDHFDLDRTGEELIAALPVEERKHLLSYVEANNKFRRCDANTRWHIYVVNMFVDPKKPNPTTLCQPDHEEARELEGVREVGGLRFVSHDEDAGKDNAFKALSRAWIFKILANAELMDDDVLNRGYTHGAATISDLIYFDSEEEAVVSMNTTFGKVLPQQFNIWKDIDSDETLHLVITAGMGQNYLRTPQGTGSHKIPDGAILACDLEYMGKYDVRGEGKVWMRYGATVYLGTTCDAGTSTETALHEMRPIAIYTCEHKRIFVPGDAGWEVAKAVFRMSLVISITLKDHLAMVHWVHANGLMLAPRETLDPTHPVRRLVIPHIFKTASVNWSARFMLLPVDQFAYRAAAFTESGWVDYFTDVLAEWRYQTFPEMMRSRMPQALLDQLPLYSDGILVWQCMQKYVRRYLEAHYSSDPAVRQDDDLIRFWAHFESQFDTPWRLPPLTLDSLVDLITDQIWWVTAGHEQVGSIVEYLTHPKGFPLKLALEKVETDVQTFAQGLVVIALTGIKQPALMADWTHVFLEAEWGFQKSFQAELQACQETIDKRNIEREKTPGKKQYVAVSPRILESSVSI